VVTTGGFLKNGDSYALFKVAARKNVAITIPWLFVGRWCATTSE
jgi:hypothetical protein